MPTKKIQTTGRAKTFTIDRATWVQGGLLKRLGVISQLRNDNGTKCCLGFYSIACGVRGVTGVSSPDGLDEIEFKKLDQRLFSNGEKDSELSCDLMLTNDAMHISDKVREQRVVNKFAKLGVTVKFKGKYPY